MTELSDYQRQVAKMQRWNRLVIGMTVGLMLLIFFTLLGYAIWQGSKSSSQTAEIIAYIQKQREVTSVETGINREGGDIIRCMILITNTTEPKDRTLEQVNNCYPGGSPEAWAKRRAEALSNE